MTFPAWKNVHMGYMVPLLVWDHAPNLYIFPCWECHMSWRWYEDKINIISHLSLSLFLFFVFCGGSLRVMRLKLLEVYCVRILYIAASSQCLWMRNACIMIRIITLVWIESETKCQSSVEIFFAQIRLQTSVSGTWIWSYVVHCIQVSRWCKFLISLVFLAEMKHFCLQVEQ
jgi:hypothetical protein